MCEKNWYLWRTPSLPPNIHLSPAWHALIASMVRQKKNKHQWDICSNRSKIGLVGKVSKLHRGANLRDICPSVWPAGLVLMTDNKSGWHIGSAFCFAEFSWSVNDRLVMLWRSDMNSSGQDHSEAGRQVCVKGVRVIALRSVYVVLRATIVRCYDGRSRQISYYQNVGSAMWHADICSQWLHRKCERHYDVVACDTRAERSWAKRRVAT